MGGGIRACVPRPRFVGLDGSYVRRREEWCIDGTPGSATRAAVVEPKQPTEGPREPITDLARQGSQAGAGLKHASTQTQTRGWESLGNAVTGRKPMFQWTHGTAYGDYDGLAAKRALSSPGEQAYQHS